MVEAKGRNLVDIGPFSVELVDDARYRRGPIGWRIGLRDLTTTVLTAATPEWHFALAPTMIQP